MKEFKITELFTSIEGEGIRSGELAFFVRFFGCNLDCAYCDTGYSREAEIAASPAAPRNDNMPTANRQPPFTLMTLEEITAAVKKSGCVNVTVTGGEPLIQENIAELLAAIAGQGCKINVETNGSINIKSVPCLSGLFFTCDYKSPSSGMSGKMFLTNISALTENDVLKFVVSNKNDLLAALEILNKYPPKCYTYLSPVYGTIAPAEIVRFMKEHKLVERVRVQLQLHKYIGVR